MCRGLKKYSTNAKRNGEGFEDLITNEWKEKKKMGDSNQCNEKDRD